MRVHMSANPVTEGCNNKRALLPEEHKTGSSACDVVYIDRWYPTRFDREKNAI